MIEITENIEEPKYNHKEWFKEMTALIGEQFDATLNYERSLSVGYKIHFDADNPKLPKGLTIPKNSKITLEKLQSKTLVVLDISSTNSVKKIKLGIRSTESADY